MAIWRRSVTGPRTLALVAAALAAALLVPRAAWAQGDIFVLFPRHLSQGASSSRSFSQMFTALVDGAERSIDVALYEVDQPEVMAALIRAHDPPRRTVRIVAHAPPGGGPGAPPLPTALPTLQAAGVPIVVSGRSSLHHNKFAVFDGRTVWTGSTNFTDSAMARNAENSVVITSTDLAQAYGSEFELMYGTGTFGRSKPVRTPVPVRDPARGLDLEVAFVPKGGAEEQIVAAIDTADASVDVAMFVFTNRRIAESLVRARYRRAAQVRVMLEPQQATTRYSASWLLCAARIEVIKASGGSMLHNKYAVVDAGASAPAVITGSANWTGSGLEQNDENVLILRDGGVAGRYQANYNQLVAELTSSRVCPVGRVELPILLVRGRWADVPPR